MSLATKIELGLIKYNKYLKNSLVGIDGRLWIFFALLFGAGAFVPLFLFFDNLIIGIVGFVAIVDIFIGYPIFKEESRVNKIEKALPSALREMADILKSGGTYEYALREISTLDYGPLSKELNKVLIRLEEGSNFETALSYLGRDIDSDLVKKIVSIITDSVRAGAGLSDVLEDVANDARKLYKLDQDRKAKTTMQMLFIIAAGAIIAPAIFGLVVTIVEFLIDVSANSGIASAGEIQKAILSKETIINSLTFYILIESLASSFMITFMRSRTTARVFLYFPMFLTSAICIFYAIAYLSKYLLIGLF